MAKTNDTSKTPGAAKRKTPAGTGRTHRSSSAMTQKMKACQQSLAPEASDKEDGYDDEIKIVTSIYDENVDPGGPKVNKEGVVVVPNNMLPIPASMVAALMRTYTSDAATLWCLAAIDANKERPECETSRVRCGVALECCSTRPNRATKMCADQTSL